MESMLWGVATRSGSTQQPAIPPKSHISEPPVFKEPMCVVGGSPKLVMSSECRQQT